MYGIKEIVTNEYVIQKSRFITILYPIESKDEVSSKLQEVKRSYPGATHYCYSYLCDNEKRANDDGEPSGTAGNPILTILENKALNNILCVVVRYFGGIKLGAPGLVRAYGTATRLAIEKATLGIRTPSLLIESTFSYEQSRQMNYLLKDATVVEQSFTEHITYHYIISEKEWNIIKQEISMRTISTHIIKTLYQVI